MAKKNDAAQEPQQDPNDVLVAYDRRTKDYGVITGLDEEKGQFDWHAPEGDYKKNMLQIPHNTWVGAFLQKFSEQYDKPSNMGLRFFRTPVDAVDKVLNSIVKVLVEEKGTAADRQVLEDSELNDEGRLAKMPAKYKFEDRDLPIAQMAEWGITPEIMKEHKSLGDFMKGYVTDTPIPIRKKVNGEWKDMGEACFCGVRIGKEVQLQVLPVLNKEQFNMAPYKDLFTQEQKDRLATEKHLGETVVIKDFATGKECECYVSYHEPTKRINTLPVADLKIPDEIYRQKISADNRDIMRAGGRIEMQDFQRRNGQVIGGTAQVDANRRDVCFTKNDDQTLRIGKTVNGARIDDKTRKLLENHELAYVEGMKTKDGRPFNDDVRFSDTNVQLIGAPARNYKSRIGQENDPRERRQNRPRRGVAALPEMKRSGKKKIA